MAAKTDWAPGEEVDSTKLNALGDEINGKAATSHTHSVDSLTDGTTNRLYTAAEKSKLAAVAANATANDTDGNLKNRANHTGTQSSSTIADFTEAVQDAVAALLQGSSGVTLSYDDAANTLTIVGSGSGGGGLDAEAVRDAIGVALIGTGVISVSVNDAADTITITSTATANDTDANLKNRANHTGTQPASTISDFTTAADARVAAGITGKQDSILLTPKGYGESAPWTIPGQAFSALGTWGLSVNNDYCVPFIVDRPWQLNAWTIELTTALGSAAAARAVVYPADLYGQGTGTVAAYESGEVTVGTATGAYGASGLAVTLQPGLYVVALAPSAAMTVRAWSSAVGGIISSLGANSLLGRRSRSRTYGAWGTTPPRWNQVGVASVSANPNVPILLQGVYV